MSITAIITFIIILFCLVTIHELGHFLFAKLTKMRVEEFAFGFPPRLFSKNFWGTNFSFNLIPLGGYVKIFGENGENNDKHNSFSAKSPLLKILVLLGGVLFNLITAIIIFTFIFWNSSQVHLDTKTAKSTHFSSREVIVTNINEKSNIYNKIPNNSKIVSISGPEGKLENENLTAEEVKQYLIAFPKDIFTIEYAPSRIFTLNNKDKFTETELQKINTLNATLTNKIIPNEMKLGASFYDLGFKQRTFLKAFADANVFVVEAIKMIVLEIIKLIKNSLNGNGNISESLSGPIGLALITNDVVKEGFEQVFYLAAMLSLSLAVFNLLPIPALDGGRILFVLPELFFKKKMNVKIEGAFNLIGFVLLIILMIIVSYLDISKII